tara:strand:- start:42 stop:251 length:210 start_codon:yes stop_codon:yes gene_type:complete
MNYIVSIFALIALLLTNPAYASGEEKKVCKDKKDKADKVIMDKDGKPQQICKTIKVHKKLEGTEVPVKK